MARLQAVADLETYRKEILARRDPEALVVAVCAGPGCLAYASGKIAAAFQAELAGRGLGDSIRVMLTGCHGFCQRGPSVLVHPKGIAYLKVKPEDVPEIVETTLVQGGVVERLLYEGEDGARVALEKEIPFYQRQNAIVFGPNRFIDPYSVEDYIALVNGDLNAMTAFMQGKVKVKGDMGLAFKLQSMFGLV